MKLVRDILVILIGGFLLTGIIIATSQSFTAAVIKAEPDPAQIQRVTVRRNRLTAAVNRAIRQCRQVPSPQAAHDCEVSFLASWMQMLTQIDAKPGDDTFHDVDQRITKFETVIDEWERKANRR